MMTKGKNWEILFIDDDEDDYVLIRDMLADLERVSIHVEWAPNYQNAFLQLREKPWDVVLVDYDLGTKTGIQLIREAHSLQIAMPFVMVTGRGSYELDIEAMQAGAFDYLSKYDLTPVLLERVIRYAIERRDAEMELGERVAVRTEELRTALEELQVVEEELRTQLEKTLESKEGYEKQVQRFVDLFENAPAAYILTDSLGAILEANALASALLNTGNQYLKGKPLTIFVDKGGKKSFRSLINEVEVGNSTHECEVRLFPRGKPKMEVRMIVSPIKDLKGETLAIRWLIIPKQG